MAQQVNRYSKRRFVKRGIIGDHEVQPKFIATIFRQRYTDQATPVLAHEIHYFRGNGGSCSNKITFILTVLIIHYNDHLTFPDVTYGILYRIKHNQNFYKGNKQ